MKSYYKFATRKYYIACTILGGALIALWVAYYSFTNNHLGAILFLLVELIINKFFVAIIANKTLLPMLCNNLDAVGFQKLINDKHLVVPLIYRTSASMAIGDYQTAINIATKQLSNKTTKQQKKHIKLKYYYLGVLARACFELRAFDDLKVVYAKYEEYKTLYSSKSFFSVSNSVWSYYQYFLDNDYESCMVVCKERDLDINSKKQDAKIRKLMNDFLYAVACYEKEEKEMALIAFSNIINYAPNMHLANVSKKYLEAIKANSQLEIFEKIAPQEEYQVFDNNQLKKARRNRIITSTLFMVLAVFMVITFHMDTKNKEYEKDLNNALSQHYDQAEFVKYFNVKTNGQYIDALCVVDTKNGWDLVSIITYDEGKTSDIIILLENINTHQSYCIKSAVSEYYIGFQIYTSKPKDTHLYYIVDFTYNDKNYWLAIDYIGDTPTN